MANIRGLFIAIYAIYVCSGKRLTYIRLNASKNVVYVYNTQESICENQCAMYHVLKQHNVYIYLLMTVAKIKPVFTLFSTVSYANANLNDAEYFHTHTVACSTLSYLTHSPYDDYQRHILIFFCI